MGFDIVVYPDKPRPPLGIKNTSTCNRSTLHLDSLDTLFTQTDDWGKNSHQAPEERLAQMAVAFGVGYYKNDNPQISYNHSQLRKLDRSFSWGDDWSTLDWPTRLKIFQEIEKTTDGEACQAQITLNNQGDVDHFKQNGGYNFCFTTTLPEPIPHQNPYSKVGGDFYIHRTVGYNIFYISASSASWSILNQVNAKNCISIRVERGLAPNRYYVGYIKILIRSQPSVPHDRKDFCFTEVQLSEKDDELLLRHVKTEEYTNEGRMVDISSVPPACFDKFYDEHHDGFSPEMYHWLKSRTPQSENVTSPNKEVIFHVGCNRSSYEALGLVIPNLRPITSESTIFSLLETAWLEMPTNQETFNYTGALYHKLKASLGASIFTQNDINERIYLSIPTIESYYVGYATALFEVVKKDFGITTLPLAVSHFREKYPLLIKQADLLRQADLLLGVVKEEGYWRKKINSMSMKTVC